MEGSFVVIRVHPTIREFIIDTNGSDLIVPNKDDLLWKITKANLTTWYEDSGKTADGDCTIRIALLDSHSEKVFTNFAGKYRGKYSNYIHMNSMYRTYITEQGMNDIARELRMRFKDAFHTFVMGALVGNPKLKQKDAFTLFIDKFNLSENEITFEMLKKSWDRSDHKKSVFSKKSFCTILF